MKSDVLKWAAGESAGKLVSKETLNHPQLVEVVSGLNAYSNTAEAFRRAYKALGIDLINRVPTENAPEPTPQGECRPHPTKPYNSAPLGIYDTIARHTYPCSSVESVWDHDIDSLEQDLEDPVPHPHTQSDIALRQQAIGDVGMYYPMLYTTLFMFPVETLGWEMFLTAAAIEPERFHEQFLAPCAARSRAIVAGMAEASESPLIFVHDDLAISTGPVFSPSWYDQYIFPHYPEILSGAKKLGKRVVLVCDGNITEFLPRLIEAGFDGVMFETPATPLDAIIEHFRDRFMIGGIETSKLTFGSPSEIRRMVMDLADKVRDCPGFAIAGSGGLHGNIPLSNLEAYFDARAEIGATPMDWRTCCRHPAE